MYSTFLLTHVLTEVAGRGQETATSKCLTMYSTFLLTHVLAEVAGRGQETARSKCLTMDSTFLLTYSLKLQVEVRRLQQASA